MQNIYQKYIFTRVPNQQLLNDHLNALKSTRVEQ